MIRYALKCSNDHGFESWFASAEAFDSLRAAGMVACLHCGTTAVEKTLMAPAVRSARKAAGDGRQAETDSGAGAGVAAPTGGAAEGGRVTLGHPGNRLERAIAALRRHVETNSEYVGTNFAAEARAIHEGESPDRAIYGEARPEEARQLIEDGVPVAPLPFMSQRKTN